MPDQNSQIQRVLIKPPLKGLDMHTDPLSITEQDARELVNYMPPTTMLQVRPAFETIYVFEGVCMGVFSFYNGETFQLTWENIPETIGKALAQFPSYTQMNSRVLLKLRGWDGIGRIAEFDPLYILGNKDSADVKIQLYKIESDTYKEDYASIVNWLLIPDGSVKSLCTIYQPKHGFCPVLFEFDDPNTASTKKVGIGHIDQITVYRNFVYFSRLYGSDIFFYDCEKGSPETATNWDPDKSALVWERDQDVGENSYRPVLAGSWSLIGLSKEGGYIIKLFTMSVNSQSGVVPYLAIMMNTGELILYGGTHPPLDSKDTSEWKIMGQWDVPIPLNNRCICEVEGETFMVTRNGIVSINRIVFGTNSNITMPMEYKLTQLFDSYAFRVNAFKNFFFLKYMAERRLLYFNVPSSMSFPLSEIAPGFTFDTDTFLQFSDQLTEEEIEVITINFFADYIFKYMVDFSLYIKFAKTSTSLLGEGIKLSVTSQVDGPNKSAVGTISYDLLITTGSWITEYNMAKCQVSCSNIDKPIGKNRGEPSNMILTPLNSDHGDPPVYSTINPNMKMYRTNPKGTYYPNKNIDMNIFKGGKEVEYIYPESRTIYDTSGFLLDLSIGQTVTYREKKLLYSPKLNPKTPIWFPEGMEREQTIRDVMEYWIFQHGKPAGADRQQIVDSLVQSLRDNFMIGNPIISSKAANPIPAENGYITFRARRDLILKRRTSDTAKVTVTFDTKVTFPHATDASIEPWSSYDQRRLDITVSVLLPTSWNVEPTVVYSQRAEIVLSFNAQSFDPDPLTGYWEEKRFFMANPDVDIQYAEGIDLSEAHVDSYTPSFSIDPDPSSATNSASWGQYVKWAMGSEFSDGRPDPLLPIPAESAGLGGFLFRLYHAKGLSYPKNGQSPLWWPVYNSNGPYIGAAHIFDNFDKNWVSDNNASDINTPGGGRFNWIFSAFYFLASDSQNYTHYNFKDLPFINQTTVVAPYESTQFVFNTQYGTWSQWEDINMASMFEHAGNFFFLRQETDKEHDVTGYHQITKLCQFNYDLNMDENVRPVNVSHLSGWTELNNNLNKQLKKVKIYGTSAAFWRDKEIPAVVNIPEQKDGTTTYPLNMEFLDKTTPYFDPKFPNFTPEQAYQQYIIRTPVDPFYQFKYALDFKDPVPVYYQHYLNVYQIKLKVLRKMGKTIEDVPKFTTNERRLYQSLITTEALRVQNIQLSLLNVDPASKISIGSEMAITVANVIIYGYELYFNLTNFY